MSKVYEKIDLELDEVIQRCLDGLKYFFTSELGKEWLNTIDVFPPFLTKSFIDLYNTAEIIDNIKKNISKANKEYNSVELKSQNADSYTSIVKGVR